MGGMDTNLTVMLRGIVFSFGTGFLTSVSSGADELDDAEGDAVEEVVPVSRGGVFSADPVSVSSGEADDPAPKNPLSLPEHGNIRFMGAIRWTSKHTSDRFVLDLSESDGIRDRHKARLR